MVARNAKRRAGFHHRHHQPQHVGYPGAAVNEVSDKNGLTSRWRSDAEVPIVLLYCIAKLGQQADKLFEASVNITDEIEGTMFVFEIVPELLSLDLQSFDLFRSVEDVQVTEPLAFESAE
jgi:hypothetical protein